MEWLTDEWHDNQNYKKELGGRLGVYIQQIPVVLTAMVLGDAFHGFCAKLYTVKYDDDLRTVHKMPTLLAELIETAGFEVYLGGHLPVAINPEDGTWHTGGSKFLNNIIPGVSGLGKIECQQQHCCNSIYIVFTAVAGVQPVILHSVACTTGPL